MKTKKLNTGMIEMIVLFVVIVVIIVGVVGYMIFGNKQDFPLILKPEITQTTNSPTPSVVEQTLEEQVMTLPDEDPSSYFSEVDKDIQSL